MNKENKKKEKKKTLKTPVGSLLPHEHIGEEAKSEQDSASLPSYKTPSTPPMNLHQKSSSFSPLFLSIHIGFLGLCSSKIGAGDAIGA